MSLEIQTNKQTPLMNQGFCNKTVIRHAGVLIAGVGSVCHPSLIQVNGLGVTERYKMLLSEVTNSGNADIALQICENNDWCISAQKLDQKPQPTRLGYCSYCWSEIKVNV